MFSLKGVWWEGKEKENAISEERTSLSIFRFFSNFLFLKFFFQLSKAATLGQSQRSGCLKGALDFTPTSNAKRYS